MSEPTTFDTQKLAEALAEKSGEARAAGISTQEVLAALTIMGVSDPEAGLRQALARLSHRPGPGIRA